MKYLSEKLVIRLTVVGALQVLALVLVGWLSIPLAFYFQNRTSPQGIIRNIAGALGDPAQLKSRVETLQKEHGIDLSLFDETGQAVASNVEPPLSPRRKLPSVDVPLSDVPLHPGGRLHGPVPFGPPIPLDWLPGHRRVEPPLMVVPLLDRGREYTLVLRLPSNALNYAPIMLTVGVGILVVGFGSVLTARFITLPLERLSKVVLSFGAGELTARSELDRRDEVGLLAKTFNEMADRIQALRAAERELLGNVAHELRTPLARIRVALELAEESDSAMARRALLGIDEDLSELEALLEDVLTATRLRPTAEGANLILHKRSVTVGELVSSVGARFSAQHPDRVLHLEHSADETAVWVDEVLVRRALANLLENANKYSPNPESPVALRTSVDRSWCTFSVEDCGMGIDPADQEKVFLPFYRAEQSRSKSTGGVGLGLTLAKRIAEAHGGSLHLDSELGVGTTVRVSVPLGS